VSREPEVPDTCHPELTVEGGDPLQWKLSLFALYKSRIGQEFIGI